MEVEWRDNCAFSVSTTRRAMHICIHSERDTTCHAHTVFRVSMTRHTHTVFRVSTTRHAHTVFRVSMTRHAMQYCIQNEHDMPCTYCIHFEVLNGYWHATICILHCSSFVLSVYLCLYFDQSALLCNFTVMFMFSQCFHNVSKTVVSNSYITLHNDIISKRITSLRCPTNFVFLRCV